MKRLLTIKERNDRYIRRVLILSGGSVGKAAKVLGVGRATLYRWLLAMGFKLKETQESRLIERRLKDRVEYLSREFKTL